MLLPSLLLFFADTDVADLMRKFTQVYSIVEAHAAEPVIDDQAFYRGAIPSLMRELDPHSIFFDPDDFRQLQDMERSTVTGFGTIVSIVPGRVIILQTAPGSAAAKEGLQPGDEVVELNQYRLALLSPEQIMGLLGEARRNTAFLGVRRAGEAKILRFLLTPQQMTSTSVDLAFEIRPGVGFLRITSFDDDTGKHVKRAIEKLGGTSLKGLIVDLRNNPGGVVTAAVDTAALFLPPSSKVLSVRGRNRKGEDTETPLNAKPYTFPLVVLINGKSASASEIVAGAMQDHKRAMLIGEQSYGKGLVQSVLPLAENTGLALTIAYYFTPSGRSIQRHLKEGQLETLTHDNVGGLTPDHVVFPENLTRLREVLEASGYIVSFATDYVRAHPGVSENTKITNDDLGDFKVYLSERQVSPRAGDWSLDLEWTRTRLQQEVFNLTLGVAKGDEVEMRRDPQVRRALEALQE